MWFMDLFKFKKMLSWKIYILWLWTISFLPLQFPKFLKKFRRSFQNFLEYLYFEIFFEKINFSENLVDFWKWFQTFFLVKLSIIFLKFKQKVSTIFEKHFRKIFKKLFFLNLPKIFSKIFFQNLKKNYMFPKFLEYL